MNECDLYIFLQYTKFLQTDFFVENDHIPDTATKYYFHKFLQHSLFNDSHEVMIMQLPISNSVVFHNMFIC
jgi:hypothetical protein